MCGRAYSTYTDEELYFQYLNRQIRDKGPAPGRLIFPDPSEVPKLTNYNFCPTQSLPILRAVEGARRFDFMQWQLVPRWEKEFKTKISTINARSETIFDSKLYGKLITRQRCIVPLSGFFEWRKEGTAKRPFKIYRQDGAIMSMAGIWDTWHGGSPDERRSFTILTTDANETMKVIHNRMPVILSECELDEWLDPEIQERDAVAKFMKPCPAEWLATTEISTMVNSPRNNSESVLEAFSQTQ